jgi:hypothetical protein
LRLDPDGPGHDSIDVDRVEIAATMGTARDAEKKTKKGMTS